MTDSVRDPSGQALVASDEAQLHGLHPSGFDPSRASFAFGDEQWPGLAKLVEECGEVVQVVGKLMMTHGSPAHWSGNMREQLVDELGDLQAAIEFVAAECLTTVEREALTTRSIAKMVKFMDWHADMDADPPPAIAMEARQARDGETRLDPKDDSAGRQASPGDSA